MDMLSYPQIFNKEVKAADIRKKKVGMWEGERIPGHVYLQMRVLRSQDPTEGKDTSPGRSL